jgi:Leucine-rich repeat (LRR) protein
MFLRDAYTSTAAFLVLALTSVCNTQVRDVSALASCQSLHTLDLNDTHVSDVPALASCQSLHTVDLNDTHVSDVPALASCQALLMAPVTNVLLLLSNTCPQNSPRASAHRHRQTECPRKSHADTR